MKKQTGNLLIGGLALAAGAYFLLFKSGEMGGGSGGGGGLPADVVGNLGASPAAAIFAGGPKKSSYVSPSSPSAYSMPVSSATGAFQSSYPVVMYDTKKGGNQLAVQSAPQYMAQGLTAKLTGGLGKSNDLSATNAPIVMYDTKKGGNQLAVQSATQPKTTSLFSNWTGGLGAAKDLTINTKKASSIAASPAKTSTNYSSQGGGNYSSGSFGGWS